MKLYFQLLKIVHQECDPPRYGEKSMTKKYARFLPTTESFTLEDFPYYWITQVHAQYVQNIDNALKNMV